MAARPPDMSDWYSRQGLQVKGGGITLQAGGAIKGGQTAYNTGTGFFLGYSGGAYKFSIGTSSSGITWDGSALTVKGNISGTSNINITGTANLNGSTLGGDNKYYALTINNTGSNPIGGIYARTGTSTAPAIYARSDITTVAAIFASAAGNNTAGAVQGATDFGIGLMGQATGTGTGVYARSVSGTALYVDGPMQINTTSLVSNLNADLLDGQHASSFLGVSAQAVDSAQLAGYGPGNWLRQTGVTAGTITPNYYITVVSGGITVRVPCAYP